MPNSPSDLSPRALLAIAAATAPSLLAYNVSPSPTFLNQALALALWGGFVIAAAPGSGRASRGAGPLLAALALLLAAVLWSWGPGALPMGLALSAVGLLLAAAVLVASGAGAHARPDAAQAFGDFCLAWVVAGVLNVGIAAVQVFAPGWTDGDWLATSGIPGRAVGNLRQPNHLSSLLLWSAIAVVALLELRRLSRGWAVALFAAMVFAVVLTASRTGTVSVVLLALWGLADRRLARPTRALLLAAPVVYAVAWFGMAEWAQLTQAAFGGAARLAESDVSGSRFGIWANTLALIRQHPWGGVGFGEFNFAWSLTPFPGRPTAFFDHTHNLPLQLAVELGLPLAALVLGLLLWALARAALAAWRDGGDTGTGRRCATVMVVMIGLHSLLEYPLWYSYFLLPAAWAWAFALGRSDGIAARGASPPARSFVAAGAALVLGAVLAVADYRSVAAIFSASTVPLAERIADGQRSVLFAHHADYAAATTAPDDAPADLQPFERATHYLLDTRLMMAWARALAQQGDLDAARAVAARLREFRNPGARDFFAPCAAAGAASAPTPAPEVAASAAPFQCAPPGHTPDWREFQRP
ncbi:Wzy polymerase domain-containing protein [Rubrivivax sp. RP6-9]|uniref:PglL family O-oligosaccharyltransferase n=1 Tax=Rubrivivax sp. RP6-9 TaxID=3415750 RepID=UPI003CC53EC1